MPAKKAYVRDPALVTLMVRAAIDMDLAGNVVRRNATKTYIAIAETLAKSDDLARMGLKPAERRHCREVGQGRGARAQIDRADGTHSPHTRAHPPQPLPVDARALTASLPATARRAVRARARRPAAATTGARRPSSPG